MAIVNFMTGVVLLGFVACSAHKADAQTPGSGRSDDLGMIGVPDAGDRSDASLPRECDELFALEHLYIATLPAEKRAERERELLQKRALYVSFKGTKNEQALPGLCGDLARAVRTIVGGRAPSVPAQGPTVVGRIIQATQMNVQHTSIHSIVHDNQYRFRKCYADGLGKNPSLRGSIGVSFVIDERGKVITSINAGSDLPDADVVSCVLREVGRIDFPAPEAGQVTVVYSFSFNLGEVSPTRSR